MAKLVGLHGKKMLQKARHWQVVGMPENKDGQRRHDALLGRRRRVMTICRFVRENRRVPRYPHTLRHNPYHALFWRYTVIFAYGSAPDQHPPIKGYGVKSLGAVVSYFKRHLPVETAVGGPGTKGNVVHDDAIVGNHHTEE